MTGGKPKILLLAGAVIIVVILAVARASKKRPAEPVSPKEKPYPSYSTPEELMRDHEKAFKFLFDGGKTLKGLLGDYYVCLAFRDRNPGHCDVVDSWMIAKLSPPICRLRYYEANLWKELFTSEAPPPTCLALTKMMKLVGARAEQMCTNKELGQVVRKGDVKRFCAFLKAAGIAPPEDLAPCDKEFMYLAGNPGLCLAVEDAFYRGACEAKSSLVKSLREGKPDAAATYAYGPLLGAEPATACGAVGKRALEYYEASAASFVQVQEEQEAQKGVASKSKAMESEGAQRERLAKEEAERANAERERQTQEKLRKMIEETKAAQAEKERKMREEAEQAVQKQKRLEEERRAKLAKEFEKQKRRRNEEEMKKFQRDRQEDEERKKIMKIPFTEYQQRPAPGKKASKDPAAKAGAEGSTP